MDTPLASLLDLWLSTPTESPNWQPRLDQLVKAVLGQRKIAKRRPEQPQESIYQTIIDALADEIREVLYVAFQADNTRRLVTVPWLSNALKQAYPQVLTYDRLTQLAIILQKQPFRSPNWQYALSDLFEAVNLSNKLRRPNWATQLPPEEYADIKNEALANAVRDIHNFNSERSHFIGWINQIYLERRGRDTYIKTKDTLERGNRLKIRQISKVKKSLSLTLQKANLSTVHPYLSLYISRVNNSADCANQTIIANWVIGISILGHQGDKHGQLISSLSQKVFNNIIETISLDTPITNQDGSQQTLDIPNSTPNGPPRTQFLMECLDSCEGDRCNLFLDKHLRNHPTATLRFIAQQRIQGKKLKEIGALFGVIPQTIRNFYERNMTNVTECLKKCIEDKTEIWKSQNSTS